MSRSGAGPSLELPDRPLVSALVPLRDGARFLPDSIGAIRSQDHEPIELIIFENDSTDGSYERARELAPTAEIIKGAPGSTVTTARNRLLTHASGDLIGFCDCDDIWSAGRVGAMIEALRSNPRAGSVFGEVETFHCPLLSDQERSRLPPAGERVAPTFSTTMLARRELVEETGPFAEEAGLGDFGEWLARARLTDWEELRIDALVLRRRMHTGSLTFRNSDRLNEYATAMAMAIKARRRAAAGLEGGES